LSPKWDITCDMTSTVFGDGGTGGQGGRDGDKERVKGTKAGRKGGRDGGREGETGSKGRKAPSVVQQSTAATARN
jgi:hypothetical protein